MQIEEAKRLLTAMGFVVVEGEYVMQFFGGHEAREPLFGVGVSPDHHCSDEDCKGVHVLATRTAMELMNERALRAVIDEELAGNR